MIGLAKESFVRAKATDLLRAAWKRREEFFAAEPDILSFLHEAPRMIATHLLGVRVEEPSHISASDLERVGPLPGFKLAGFLDREASRIVIARDCKEEVRRFTLGHEIAHWVLHPFEILHRDLPLYGAEQRHHQRKPVEFEADIFSAELLMPEKSVRQAFQSAFGLPIDGGGYGDSVGDSLVLRLGSKVRGREFLDRGQEFRALVVAQAIGYRGRAFPAMHSAFRVSPTAMAIQLVRLGLVL